MQQQPGRAQKMLLLCCSCVHGDGCKLQGSCTGPTFPLALPCWLVLFTQGRDVVLLVVPLPPQPAAAARLRQAALLHHHGAPPQRPTLRCVIPSAAADWRRCVGGSMLLQMGPAHARSSPAGVAVGEVRFEMAAGLSSWPLIHQLRQNCAGTRQILHLQSAVFHCVADIMQREQSTEQMGSSTNECGGVKIMHTTPDVCRGGEGRQCAIIEGGGNGAVVCRGARPKSSATKLQIYARRQHNPEQQHGSLCTSCLGSHLQERKQDEPATTVHAVRHRGETHDVDDRGRGSKHQKLAKKQKWCGSNGGA